MSKIRLYWIRTDEDHAYDSVEEAHGGEHIRSSYEVVPVIEKSAYDKVVRDLKEANEKIKRDKL
ncbi:MAG: hypothetical protein COB41_00215 [Proteobacteria bacterium]|nr:MAG: hypothetical protein COB41_00215 [Pseudomonadota bacterium]